jgi:hypothetical protein
VLNTGLAEIRFETAWLERSLADESGALAIRRRIAADIGAEIRERKRLTHVQFADFGFNPNFAARQVARFIRHGFDLLLDLKATTAEIA